MNLLIITLFCISTAAALAAWSVPAAVASALAIVLFKTS